MSETTAHPVTRLPAPVRGLIDWDMMMDLALANPGTWIQSEVSVNPAVAHQIRRGVYRVDPTIFEVVSRQAERRGRSWIFLRTR